MIFECSSCCALWQCAASFCVRLNVAWHYVCGIGSGFGRNAICDVKVLCPVHVVRAGGLTGGVARAPIEPNLGFAHLRTDRKKTAVCVVLDQLRCDGAVGAFGVVWMDDSTVTFAVGAGGGTAGRASAPHTPIAE